jgi:hypothetical protein
MSAKANGIDKSPMATAGKKNGWLNIDDTLAFELRSDNLPFHFGEVASP